MLKDRLVRVHLIEIYKSVNGLDKINWERNPKVNTQKAGLLTRSNGFKIRRDTFKSKIRNYFAREVSARNNYFFKPDMECFTGKYRLSSNSKHI